MDNNSTDRFDIKDVITLHARALELSSYVKCLTATINVYQEELDDIIEDFNFIIDQLKERNE